LDNINRELERNNAQCTYSYDETPILGGNNIDFTRLPSRANVIILPFKFSWMGHFVLQIDIFNDKTCDGQPYYGSERELIISTIIRSSIWTNSSWENVQRIDSSLNKKQFSFRYRVSCSTDFYGEQCSRFCSPLSIHSQCDQNTGDIVCQQGWTGTDCNKGRYTDN
jgi:delta-like protein